MRSLAESVRQDSDQEKWQDEDLPCITVRDDCLFYKAAVWILEPELRLFDDKCGGGLVSAIIFETPSEGLHSEVVLEDVIGAVEYCPHELPSDILEIRSPFWVPVPHGHPEHHNVQYVVGG